MKSIAHIYISLLAIFLMACEPESPNELIQGNITGHERQQQDEDADENIYLKSKVDIYNPITDKVVGTSFLIRSNAELKGAFESDDLEPGHAYTLWWRVWNNPQSCNIPGGCEEGDLERAGIVQVEMMHAGSQIADAEGKVKIRSTLLAADDSGSINHLHGLPPAGGLHADKTFSSEVQLILRSHGPFVEELMEIQLDSYSEGCSTSLGFRAFTEIPDEIGECGDIEIAVHPPVS
ncbi:hypothetical protein E0K83_02015 [Gramella sp. BOM4]|nr:hypothetical protein [Christiangramia bathymodioli]